ncbi:DASH complex, subunit Spc34 [Akanthomyces lecanii RCEF 1005]|uniref:DASH complex subunit SPC34 n=1 Tax=Akanthomyces lecanii RCEF 1005 TaxID=1081108 RepID=A0A168H508_CORDF|nr:DASH complex, subunit Spc34 [Akanthomyces lecanii RCEF 1005]
MSQLSSHLEQISYSCQGIDSLPFPSPKIFTNALLSHHDITSLIRDTEAHERALFSVPPPPPPPTTSRSKRAASEPEDTKPAAKRRQTVFNVTTAGEVTTGPPTRGGGAQQPPRKHTAVAAVPGGEMHARLRKGELDRKGDIDVEVLLRGAEKLCGVYDLPGARERIASLRAKYRNGRDSTVYYEDKVKEQGEQLASMNRNWMDDEDEDEDGDGEDEGDVWTMEDLKREEDEARELEAKKRELQARLRNMEKDLGGLMSM